MNIPEPEIVSVLMIMQPVLMFLLIGWMLIGQRQCRKQAGQLLLSVPQPYRFNTSIGIGSVLNISYLFIVYGLLNFAPAVSEAVKSVLGLCGLAFYVRAWLSKIEIRDEGILREGALIRWSQIKSYQWGENSGRKLIIKLRHRIELQKKLKISIYPGDRTFLEQIFQQKLG